MPLIFGAVTIAAVFDTTVPGGALVFGRAMAPDATLAFGIDLA
jgi:hypothetical protein